MHHVQFAAPGRRADLLLVLGLWHELVSEWQPDEAQPLRVLMRRRHAMDTLAAYLRSSEAPEVRQPYADRACGFDIVLRLASGAVDTMHATRAFFTRADNGRWFTPVDNAQGYKCVRLTEAALDLWHSSAAARTQAIASARALLESDVESQGVIVALLPQRDVPAVSVPVPAPVPHEVQPADRKAQLEALVRRIHQEPYQPVYRKKPFGTPVTGWDARLQAYFWPSPEQGYAQTCAAMEGIADTAQGLAEALRAGGWDESAQATAVALAHAVFQWGGVPQDPATVTPQSVEQVFRAALANDDASKANMNSGWTKIAAFATGHLEGDGSSHPQVIWDSRVAAAITSRLDAQLPEGATPAGLFPGVGTVPGRGGTRPRKLSRAWPSGYRSWAGQVAGSAVVREIRDILNSGGYPAMPLSGNKSGPWTTRGVEMVLFMDGY